MTHPRSDASLYFLGFFWMGAILSAPLYASSPGMVEGPPGCTWQGAVVEQGKGAVRVRLDKLEGTCMYEPQPCGKATDVVSAPIKDGDKPLMPGATLQIWVDLDAQGQLRANLTPPKCTREPLKAGVNPTRLADLQLQLPEQWQACDRSTECVAIRYGCGEFASVRRPYEKVGREKIYQMGGDPRTLECAFSHDPAMGPAEARCVDKKCGMFRR